MDYTSVINKINPPDRPKYGHFTDRFYLNFPRVQVTRGIAGSEKKQNKRGIPLQLSISLKLNLYVFKYILISVHMYAYSLCSTLKALLGMGLGPLV